MDGWWNWLLIIGIFALGVRLSAFFSGSEIGFYRLSPLRLSVEADSGDTVSQRLLDFVQQPGYFVATTLVGNNLANYVTTLAIAMATAAAFGASTGLFEILGTVLFTPLIFVFGELIPKNLYYESPHRLLRRDLRWFLVFYRCFLIFSTPLVWISKLFDRFGGVEKNSAQRALGRKRLVQVLSEGHHEGLLTRVQNDLVQGLLREAPRTVAESMTECSRVTGVRDDLSRKQVLDFARSHGLSRVPVRRADQIHGWYGYVCVADLSLRNRPLAESQRPFFHLDISTGKLEAILALRAAESEYAAIMHGDEVLGLVTSSKLSEEFFISQQTAGH